MTGPRRTLLFTGDGKGKTTAALGMVMRAAGHGHRVLVVQFLKADDRTGELSSAKRLTGVEIVQMGRGFVSKPGSKRFAEHKRAAEGALARAGEALGSGDYDLVVLDEVCGAVSKGLVSEEAVSAALRNTAPDTTVALTGRDATHGLIDRADTVTVMQCAKHGMSQGIGAQEGVEF